MSFLPELLTGVSGALIAITGSVAALGVLAKSQFVGRPFRWLWRTNVSEPVGEWNRGIVSGVVDDRIEHLMTHRNGGSSLADLAHSVKSIDNRIGRLELNQAAVARDLKASQAEVAAELLRSQNEVAAELKHFRAGSGMAIENGVAELLEHDAERDVPGKRYDDEVSS